jgi:hypothetical protein
MGHGPPQCVDNVLLPRYKTFDDHVIDVLPNLVHIMALALHVLAESSERPLGPFIVLVHILVGLKLHGLFIDGVICQMHELVLSLPFLIFLCCESGKAFFEHVHSERIVTGDNDIYSQVELEPIDEEWIVDVPRNHMLLLHFQLADVVNEMNASASGETIGLYYP